MKCDLFRQKEPCSQVRAFCSTTNSGRLSRSVLPFHDHRHGPHAILAVVLDMNVLQHRLSGQRSRISKAAVKVFDAFGMSAGTTYEDQT
jgi:hypothetical protein